MAGRAAPVALFFYALAAAGCERLPPIQATVILADSKARGDLWRLVLPEGRPERLFSLGAPCGDLARGPGGELYFTSGREVFHLSRAGEPLPLLQVEEEEPLQGQGEKPFSVGEEAARPQLGAVGEEDLTAGPPVQVNEERSGPGLPVLEHRRPRAAGVDHQLGQGGLEVGAVGLLPPREVDDLDEGA